jgi:DNA-directed RNA polymerase specialized sigma24 family protein
MMSNNPSSSSSEDNNSDMIEIVRRAILREPDAVHTLVRAIGPVIHGRVVKALVKRAHGRDVFQDVEDMVQEIFVRLFENDAKALRAWDPARGPLGGFVALLCDHHVFSVFRSGKRRPWSEQVGTFEDEEELPVCEAPTPESRALSQQTLDVLIDRLRAELSPKGFEVFVRLYVQDQAVDVAARELGMTVDALYVWRTRLTRIVRSIAADLDAADQTDPADGDKNRRMSEMRLVRSTSSVEAS